MLVLHPRSSTRMPGPLGTVDWGLAGVSEGIRVSTVVAVIKGMLVEVGIGAFDVALAAMMSGVAVNTEGVFVGGRNGVGGLPG
jgi:hypothetical protein